VIENPGITFQMDEIVGLVSFSGFGNGSVQEVQCASSHRQRFARDQFVFEVFLIGWIGTGMDDHPVAREVVLDDFHVDSRAIDAIVRRHAYGHSEHIAERVYYRLLRMSDSPLVSVVMSVHNASAVVGQAIESILKQTFTNFEFIIIDDGSTDGSGDIVRK